MIRLRNANMSWMRVEDEEKVKEAKRKEKEEAMKAAKAAPGGKKDAVIEDIEEGKEGEEVMQGLNRAINTLSNINMIIQRGQLVCIVGSVGSGKSSLLASMLGDLYIDKTVEGAGVAVKGSVAYHSQVPWILNSTVRENILFGLPMISKKFEDAIEASALGPDLESLPNGNHQSYAQLP